jgi:hypothetical protein
VRDGEDVLGPLEVPLDGGAGTLRAERLRDGRVALGVPAAGGGAGELALLPPGSALALAAWLAPMVEGEWIDSVRDRLPAQRALAEDLYGDEERRLHRLAAQLLDEVPPGLLSRALILLANAIGPDARRSMVDELNQTSDVTADAILRRRLAEESDAFAYVVAAAAVYDGIEGDAGG